MSIRLQVVMESAELEAIRAVARERGMTVSEWVRETLRKARRESSTGDADRKLAAVRAADGHGYPTADIDQMVAEINLGYGEVDE
jgi:transposase-like protein